MIKVQINKNIVLLFALLNHFKQAPGDTDSHKLRSEEYDYFKDYNGAEPDLDKYIHSSKGVSFVLSASNAPELEIKKQNISKFSQQSIEIGSYLKPFLIDFYENTDFENYYQKLLPELEKIAENIKSIVEEHDIEKVLNEIWGLDSKSQFVIIPNPSAKGSYGPQIGETNYQVIGVWDGRDEKDYLHTIIHEASHPFAKKVLSPHISGIMKHKEKLETAVENPNFPKQYNYWKIIFEENLIRAVHEGMIMPKIDPDYPVEKGLQFEKESKGMVFIEQFYEILKQHNSVKQALPHIVNSL